jgi:hypothetical protein
VLLEPAAAAGVMNSQENLGTSSAGFAVRTPAPGSAPIGTSESSTGSQSTTR